MIAKQGSHKTSTSNTHSVFRIVLLCCFTTQEFFGLCMSTVTQGWLPGAPYNKYHKCPQW